MSQSTENDAALAVEWGVQFETRNPEPLHSPTRTQRVQSEGVARMAVKNGVPLSGTGHRVVQRLVSEWSVTPPVKGAGHDD